MAYSFIIIIFIINNNNNSSRNLAVLLITSLLLLHVDGREYCGSIDVRNNLAAVEKYVNCTVVEGSVQLVLLDRSTERDFVNVSFANLREITEYLLVYHVKGLKNLGQLFPNLAVIRGNVLFDNNALAVYANARLQELGLKSLTHIMEGSVFIYKNPNLCYIDSISWDSIMKLDSNNRTVYEVSVGQNKEFRECSSRDKCRNFGCKQDLCWSATDCQLLNLDGCHPLCAGGCYKNNSEYDCFSCKGLLAEDGKCVSSCPAGSYEYKKIRCVTEDDCRKMKGNSYFVFNGSCVDRCPSRFTRTKNPIVVCELCVGCTKYCQPELRGTNNEDTPDTFRIVSVSSSKRLLTCTHLNASLEIEIKTGTYSEGIENALKANLGTIEVIDGQLKIMHSHVLVSLNFLTNLRLIRGTNVNDTQPSFIVKDNDNLRQLWDWNGKSTKSNELLFRIERGKLLFHFNPKLCLSEIDKLVQVARLAPYTDLEVSRGSNGYKTTCDTVQLNVTIKIRQSNSVILHIERQNVTDVKYLDRSILYYRENNDTNNNSIDDSSIYRSFTECGDSKWKSIDVNRPDVFLPNLEPNVQYVCFLTTYTMSSSIGTSALFNFTTLPSQPSIPLDFHVNYTGPSEAALNWKAPYHAHGKLIYYRLTASWQPDDTPLIRNRDYCKHKNEFVTDQRPNQPVDLTHTTISTSSSSSSSSNSSILPTSYNDCHCKKDVEDKHKQGGVELCNSFEHRTDFDARIYEGSGLESCDPFFYSVMNDRYLSLKAANDFKATSGILDSFPTVDDNDPTLVDDDNSRINDIVRNVTGKNDGKYEQFAIDVPVEANGMLLTNLRHYSEYIVTLSACRQPDPDEPLSSKRCSRESILTFRTAKNDLADRIINLKIVTVNRTSNVSWDEPILANSFVHSYQVEYRMLTENSKFAEQCVTRTAFRRANYSYALGNLLSSGSYRLRVKALSLAGDGPYEQLDFRIDEQSPGYLPVVLSGLSVIAVVCAVLIGLLYYWRIVGDKNANNGINNNQNSKTLIASVNPRYEPVYLGDQWEMERENVVLIRQLGRGIFGSVHEAVLRPDDVRCAVKTTSSDSESNYVLSKEAQLMKEFRDAYHIVRLLGVVSKRKPVYVIMELMELGDLKTYLLNNASVVCDCNAVPRFERVVKMAVEIADGMAFLEGKKYVHRDLAARNCMVAGDLTVKIGDFGLARDIYETDYYRKGDRGTLPIRWMAPESIRDGVFTSHSDVWSYGVVLWEIYTLAQMPYHPRTNEQVIRYVQSGQLLDVPFYCHPLIEKIMRSCWKWHFSHRPKFTQILRILLDVYVDENDRFRRVSYYHNGTSANENDNIIPCQMQNDRYVFPTDDEQNRNLYEKSVSSSTAVAITKIDEVDEAEEEEELAGLEPSSDYDDRRNRKRIKLRSSSVTTIAATDSSTNSDPTEDDASGSTVKYYNYASPSKNNGYINSFN